MNKDFMRLVEEFRSSVSEIPCEDLSTIIFNKHLNFLENHQCNTKDDKRISRSIADLMSNAPVKYRSSLMYQLYISMCLHYVKSSLSNLKDKLGFRTFVLLRLAWEGYQIKQISDEIRLYRILGGSEHLDNVEAYLNEFVCETDVFFKLFNPYIKDILKILNNESSEYEEYVSGLDDSKSENKSFKELFHEVIEDGADLYGLDELLDDEFKLTLRDDLEAIVNGEFFKKHDGFFSSAK